MPTFRTTREEGVPWQTASDRAVGVGTARARSTSAATGVPGWPRCPSGSTRTAKRYSCETQAAAKAKLRAAQDALDRGADLGAKTQTLGAFLDAWLADVVRRDAAPKTYEGYAYTAGLIKPALGKMPLDKLAPQHVQKLLNELLERGGTAGEGLSPRTVQYVRATLRRALGRALKWGLVTRNVATLVEPPKSRRAEVQFRFSCVVLGCGILRRHSHGDGGWQWLAAG